MSRAGRLWVFAVGAAIVFGVLVAALLNMPSFGRTSHPFRTAAVHASLEHHTSNVVSSINFDQRGLDTLGEESILLASVLGVAVLLRPAQDEIESDPPVRGDVLDATVLAGYVMLPVTLIIGLDVIAHGHVTPGGGFQGGVIIGTAIQLLYLAGRYRAFKRSKAVEFAPWGEAFGTGAFACLGVIGVLVSGAFLFNIVNTGSTGSIMSGGTVPILNGAVGIGVAAGVIILMANFLVQALKIGNGHSKEGSA